MKNKKIYHHGKEIKGEPVAGRDDGLLKILNMYCERDMTIVGRTWGSIQDNDRFSFIYKPNRKNK